MAAELRAQHLAEVGETSPDVRAAALSELRARIERYNDEHAGDRFGLLGRGALKGPVQFWRADDEGFLVAMLRGAKYDVAKALAKLVALSRFVAENEWTRQPDVEAVAKAFGTCFFVLPGTDASGRTVWYFSVSEQLKLAEEEESEDVVSAELQVKASFWVMQGLLGRDESLSLGGVAILQDMANVNLVRMNRIITQDVNKMALGLFEMYPWRMKKIAVVHEPRWIGVLFMLVRAIMPAKIRQRISLYGRNYERLAEDFGTAHLPAAFHGDCALDKDAQIRHALRLVETGYPHLSEAVGKILARMEGGRGSSNGTASRLEREAGGAEHMAAIDKQAT